MHKWALLHFISHSITLLHSCMLPPFVRNLLLSHTCGSPENRNILLLSVHLFDTLNRYGVSHIENLCSRTIKKKNKFIIGRDGISCIIQLWSRKKILVKICKSSGVNFRFVNYLCVTRNWRVCRVQYINKCKKKYFFFFLLNVCVWCDSFAVKINSINNSALNVLIAIRAPHHCCS